MFTSGEVRVERQGPPEVTEALVEALRLQWSYGFPFAPSELPLLTHAFHDYPAGMQPATARHLLETVLPGKSVFDPFLGGGTVILEAMRAGRLGIGSDISPLALFVARGRTWTASDSVLKELREVSQSVCAAAATELGGDHSRQVSSKDWDALKAEIGNFLDTKKGSSHDGLRDVLWFLFSVARQRAAAQARRRKKRSKIVTHQFFHSVCIEYASAVRKLTTVTTEAAVPSVPQRPLIFRQDARQPLVSASLTTSGGIRENFEGGFGTRAFLEGETIVRCKRDSGTGTTVRGEDLYADRAEIQDGSLIVDAVLTSPPYPGVYDYLSYARSARSKLGRLSEKPDTVNNNTSCLGAVGALGFAGNPSVFVESPVPSGRNWAPEWTDGEVGAMSDVRRRRRREALSQTTSTQDKWERDQKDWLLATTSAVRAGGRLGIMIGDGDGVDTRSSLLRTVKWFDEDDATSLSVVGWATLRAAEAAKRNMRTEHLVLLERS